jgi:hypothetical protein
VRKGIAILLINERITARIVSSIHLAANWVRLLMLIMLHHKTSDSLLLAWCL